MNPAQHAAVVLGKHRLTMLILRFEAGYDLGAGPMGQYGRNPALDGKGLPRDEGSMKPDVFGIMHQGEKNFLWEVV